MAMIATEALKEAIDADRSIVGLLERRTAELGDKVLLKVDGREVTYRELTEFSRAAAVGLRAEGVGPGDRVGVMMSNSMEWVALWFGAARLGAAIVPINTAYKGEGLAYLLSHSAPKALALDAEFVERLEALEEAELPPLFTHGEPAAATLPWRSLEDLFTAGPGDGVEADPAPSSPCSILYTSGTTGPPKGCLLPHGQYLAAAYLHATNCDYDESTTVYTCLPLFHINAQNYSLLSVIAAGATLAIDSKFSASRFWERIVETDATAFNFIGAMAMALWSREPSPIEREHQAKVAFGVPVPAEIWGEWEERFGVRVIYAYGMTENALPAIVPLEDTPVAPHLRGAAGKASPTSELLVVDDDDRAVPPGVIGEILTRPKIPFTMMTEYVDRLDATVEAFRNCWFHTGDLGYLDEEGFLFYHDRKKDALRRRGEMVSSWEVETLVSKFPGVAECAVVGVPSEMTEDDIMVVIVCEQDAVDAAELIAFCEERTARFQVPRYVRFVEQLPRTQTQRVEKYRLRSEGVTADTFDATPSGRRASTVK